MKKWWLAILFISGSFLPGWAQARHPNNPMGSLIPCQVAFLVSNLEETVQWYSQKLGFELVESWQDDYSQQRTVALELNGFGIEILETPEETLPNAPALPEHAPVHPRRAPYAHLSFRVSDLEAVVHELKARGVDLLTGPSLATEREEKYCVIKDNNGNPIKLIQHSRSTQARTP